MDMLRDRAFTWRGYAQKNPKADDSEIAFELVLAAC